jgi:hypothetical protein
MTRQLLVGGFLTSFMLIGGCEKAADQQQKAVEAQNKANDKIVEASKEAQQKVNNAQAEADKKIADAQASFNTMREDYRHKVQAELIELDKKVADLEAKALKEKAKAKDELESRAKQIRAAKTTFEQHMQGLETATATTWDDAKAKLDKEWSELKAMADK